jgi:hypothetical protein
MPAIQIDGSRITFDSIGRPGHRHVIDFGEGFLSAERVGDDVVITYRSGDNIFIERRTLYGHSTWTAVSEPTLRLRIADDCCSLTVDGIPVPLAGKLRLASAQSDGVIVVVYPNDNTGTRNLYRYNLDGTLKWRVGERTFLPLIPYDGFSRRSPRLLNAAGRAPDGAEQPKNMGALIDFETGEVIAQQDPRYVM